MKTSKKWAIKTIFSVSFAAFGLLATFGLLASPAHAELAAPTAGASSAPWATEQQYCNTICPSLAGTNGQALGLSGTGGWTTADDQWCANHNAQTNPSVAASPAPVGSTVTIPCTTAVMYPGDTSCAQTTAEVTHCEYHNTQTESYCMAYEGALTGNGGEKTVLMLDIAATATCGAVCASTPLSASISEACQGAAVAAAAGQIAVVLTQKDSTMGKMLDAVGAGATAAMGVESYEATQNVTSGAGSLLNNNTAKKNACLTAAVLAALTGVRYYNMGYLEREQKSSCGNVWALQSSAATIGAGVVSASGASAVIGVSSGTGGGTVGSGSLSNGTAGLNCISTGGTVSSCTGQQVSGATDGGLLNGGLGTAALPLAQQLAAQGLPDALSGSGSPGGAMGGAMGGSDLGKALAKIADQAATDGALIASAAPYSSGGGGGGGGSTSDAPNPFAGLAGGGAAPGSSMQVFRGDGSDGNDIWHSHTDQNLFQIISGRIGKVAPRVTNF
jgi:hypothetical protein